MARHYYSSISFASSLSAAVTNAQTTITTPESATDNGWPSSFPFTLALDYGAGAQEFVDVTSKGALTGGVRTWNVTRAVDGSTAVAHNAAAIVRHTVMGRDLEEAALHVYASGGVHGITGSVVGTTDTQTLDNKTLSTLTVQTAGEANARLYTTGNAMFFGSGTAAADTRFDRTGSGEMTLLGYGSSTLSRLFVGTAAQAFTAESSVRAAAGQNRYFSWYSGGIMRWALRANSTAESGSNAGSDLELLARDDTGAALVTPISVRRSDGQVTLANALAMAGVTGATTASRYIGAVNGAAPATGGPFALGDWAVDITGGFWICTQAGTSVTALWTFVGQAARGAVGTAQVTAPQTLSTTTDTVVTGTAVSFSRFSGRRYRYTVHIPDCYNATACSLVIEVRAASGLNITPNTTAALYGDQRTPIPASTILSGVGVSYSFTVMEATTGSITVWMTAISSTASTTLFASTSTKIELTVEDIGNV